jgi:hypothetical protein
MNTPQLLLGQPPAPAPVLLRLRLLVLLRPLLRLLSDDRDVVLSDHDDVRNKKLTGCITLHIRT